MTKFTKIHRRKKRKKRESRENERVAAETKFAENHSPIICQPCFEKYPIIV